jgi:hypothetical protein
MVENKLIYIMSNSPKYQLNQTDLLKVGRYFLILLGGFIVTTLIQFMGDFDFGSYTTIVTLFVAPALEMVRRWLTDHSIAP